MFIEIATIITSLILIMGLNFFNGKFSIKSTFLEVKGRYIHHYIFPYVNIFAHFIDANFFIDKLSIIFFFFQI